MPVGLGRDGSQIEMRRLLTIHDGVQVENQIAKLMVQLSMSQDAEIGDGTTGVVVLAGSLLEQAEMLLDKGLHPIQIANGYDLACKMACENLDAISEEIPVSLEDPDSLIKIAQSCLSSKMYGLLLSCSISSSSTAPHAFSVF